MRELSPLENPYTSSGARRVGVAVSTSQYVLWLCSLSAQRILSPPSAISVISKIRPLGLTRTEVRRTREAVDPPGRDVPELDARARTSAGIEHRHASTVRSQLIDRPC